MLTRVVIGLILLIGLALFVDVLPIGSGTPTVSAVPQVPHVFYGLVSEEGGSAVPSGVTIEARINSVHYGQTIDLNTHESILDTRTHILNGDGLNYGSDVKFQVCADDESTESDIEGGENGQEITFYVNGVLATTDPQSPILFEVGGVHRVDLTIPSLNAAKAPAAAPSNSACTTESGEVEEGIPTPTPTSTPTSDDPPPGGGGPPPGGGGGGLGGGGGGAPAPRPTAEPTPTDAEIIAELVDDIDQLTAEDAADEIDSLALDDAINVIRGLDAAKAAEILDNIRASKVADLLEGLDSEQAAEIMQSLTGEKAASVIGSLDGEKAASIVQNLNSTKAAEVIEILSATSAAGLIEMVTLDKAADIAARLSAGKASNVLGRVSPGKAGKIFDELPVELLEEIIDDMSEDRLIDRLAEMSVEKLHHVSIELLFNKLPNAPVEQIAFEEPPDADRDDLTVVQVTPQLAIYTVAQTGELEWVKLVGSPVFIDRVLGKFKTNLTNVNVQVEELSGIPSGVPGVGAGQSLNQVFRVDFDNASSNDLMAVHMTFYVDKSWMEVNGIHKWSIQVNRFNEDLDMWVPYPAKRVAEDDNRITYTVVTPELSLLAITGSTTVTSSVFQVADLNVSPGLALANEEVTITARVRNTSSQTVVYPANLWLNGTIEESKSVVVGPRETIEVTFTTRKPEGEYRVRVEREFGDLSVSAQQAPNPTPTRAPATATPPPTAAPVATQPASTPTTVPQQAPPTATSVPPTPSAAASNTATPPPAQTAPTSTPQPTTVPGAVASTPTVVLPTEPEQEGGLGIGAIVGIIVGIMVVLGAAIAYMVVVRRRQV